MSPRTQSDSPTPPQAAATSDESELIPIYSHPVRVDAVPDCPDALRASFGAVEDTPERVDFHMINAGAKAYRSYGPTVRDVMADLSLIGGYRFGGPPDLLVKTGLFAGRGLSHRCQWPHRERRERLNADHH